MPLNIGAILHNRYRIDDIIAQGGMGAIYRAFDNSLNIQVAVKENLVSSQDSTRQFHREATILASLRHPNLPRVTDHFYLPDQGQYLIMDYIEGSDLRQRVESSGPIPEEEVVVIGASICGALAYLHSRQPSIVHRDIKPGNIKVTPAGQVYLVDFGIAKIASPGEGTTSGAQSLTPGYAPPEQYGKGTDHRSDIYSTGATLYLALTGKMPENGLNRLMGDSVLTPILEINPQVSPRLAASIEKALEIGREYRYQSAEAFKIDLLDSNEAVRRKMAPGVNHIESPPPTRVSTPHTQKERPLSQRTSPPPAIPHPKPARKFSPVLLGLIGLGAVGACLVIAAVILYSTGFFKKQSLGPAPATQTPTSRPTQLPTDTPQTVADTLTPTTMVVVVDHSPTPQETTAPEITSTPNATPQGGGPGQIAFASDRNGVPQVFVMNSDSSNVTQITNEGNGACQPDWSPDGSKLVFVSPCPKSSLFNPITETYPGSSLFVINADGTGRIPLASVPGGDFDPAWSPDGSSIIFTTLRDNLTSTDTNLYLYNLSSNIAEAVTSDLSRDRNPHWAPDGSQFVFQREQTERHVWIYSLDNSTPTLLNDMNKDNAFMPDWSIDNIVTFIYGMDFPQLYIKQIGSTLSPELKIHDGPAWHPTFSPDGKWIVFEGLLFLSDGSRNYELLLIPWNGGAPINLTNSPGRDYHPVWRP